MEQSSIYPKSDLATWYRPAGSSPSSARTQSPVKRLIQESRDRGSLIDATSGRKTRAVLVMDSDHLVLSALTVEELAGELGKECRGGET